AYRKLPSQAQRRMTINGEKTTFGRISDFLGLRPGITGKIELVYEGEMEGPAKVANMLIGKAIRTLMLQFFPDPEKAKKSKAPNPYKEIINWFGNGNNLAIDDNISIAVYKNVLNEVDGLKAFVKKL